MNIEIINGWGEKFLSFAWPMLWQSSLLVAVVFALDVLLARRVRAAVRHALWMVVLIKLVLPPALALPTGATWWLWPAKTTLTPVFKNTMVTIDAGAPPINFVPRTIPIAPPPPPKLSAAGMVMLASAIFSLGLLSWLGFRWLRVARKIHNSNVPTDLTDVLEDTRNLAGLRQRPRLKQVDDAQSPAVYGLFRPVILLPRALAEKLSGTQLRAVLLHEMIHLRRGDVWIHFAQTLLQIAYWWHPLLWFANARIRRLREEAVDDAVMLALRDDAEAYAPTLLQVAKYAINRPLASLGLIGILESRSALRRRIERLTDFRRPRRAGLTCLSFLGILAFSALAVPMGQAPVADDKSATSLPEPETATHAVNQNNLTTFKITNPIPDADLKNLLFQAGVKIPPTMVMYLEDNGCLLVRGNADQDAKVRDVVLTLNRKSTPPANALDIPRLAKRPAKEARATNVIHPDSRRQVIYDELNRIHVSVSYQNAKLSEVIGDLHEKTLLHDPEKSGINFLINPHVGVGSAPGIDPVTGLPVKAAVASQSADPAQIKIILKLDDVSLTEVLNAICLVSDHPIKYSVENYGIEFSEKASDAPPFEMRTFKVDPNRFYLGLQNVLPVGSGENPGGGGINVPQNQLGGALYVVATNLTGNVSAMAKELFTSLGVNLDPPKAVFFNDRLGVLFVYATPQDLDVIEKAVEVLNQNPPQVHIKARFIEVPGALSVHASPIELTNGAILTAPEMSSFLDQGEAEGLVELAEPEGTIASGRKMQFRATNDAIIRGPSVLKQRSYLVDYYGFQEVVRNVTGQEVITGFKELALKAGVDLSSPKEVFLSDNNALVVCATEKDLDALEPVIANLNCPPPQVHIKARFIEVPKGFLSKVNQEFPAGLTNGGIFTGNEMKSILRQIKSDKGVVELAEPEGTTICGRRMQLAATEDDPVITNPGSTHPKIGYLENGPLFDVSNMVLRHERLYLSAKACMLEWFGYAGLTNTPVYFSTNAVGKIAIRSYSWHPIPLKQASIQKTLYDGQTLVLFPKSEELLFCNPDEKRAVTDSIRRKEKTYKNKVLIALITTTLIDAAGNRLN